MLLNLVRTVVAAVATVVLLTFSAFEARSQNLQWVKKLDGLGFDGANALALDAAGHIYVTGFFSGSADFDPGPSVFRLTTPLNARNIFVAKLTADGGLVWAKSFRSPAQEFEESTSIVLGADGAVHVAGQFIGPTDFDPGAASHVLQSTGQTDIFVVKLTNSGQFVWARRMGSAAPEFETASALVVDADGAIYATGAFFGSADFGQFDLDAPGYGAFLAKLDSTGAFVWAKRFRSTGGGVEGFGISLAPAGHLVTTGTFEGTVDFDPGSGTAFRTAQGAADGYVAALTRTGSLLWVRRLGGPGLVLPQGGIVAGLDGTLHVSGYFLGTADFDPGPGTASFTSTQDDIFILKLTGAGDYVWSKRIGGGSEDRALALALDSEGNVYSTGHYAGAVDFDPGPGTFRLPGVPTATSGTSAYVLKLSKTGAFQWAIRFGTVPGTKPRGTYGNGMAIAGSNTVVTVGQFTARVDFDPGPGTHELLGRQGGGFIATLQQ